MQYGRFGRSSARSIAQNLSRTAVALQKTHLLTGAINIEAPKWRSFQQCLTRVLAPMSSDGHGIPDNAAMAAHQVIGHADQTQHQDELERKRSGLNDQAVNNERTFIQGAERRASVHAHQTSVIAPGT
ncbi:hypothetical protein SCAR479_08390 [Seiridium cardinale]|uniref:Uncharacterized protein n=1 Tax=Seiridium cardinale TaxID=138064 RepID=A0ABR2XMK0_9PEZI